MNRTTISLADLAENTQEVLDRVQRGEVVVVENAGRAQIVLLDALDFRLLQALAQCAISENDREPETDDPDANVFRAYLGKEISLEKASELLGLNHVDLQERFHRLGVPLHMGPADEQATAEAYARHPDSPDAAFDPTVWEDRGAPDRR